jgi:hypothetical protein
MNPGVFYGHLGEAGSARLTFVGSYSKQCLQTNGPGSRDL